MRYCKLRGCLLCSDSSRTWCVKPSGQHSYQIAFSRYRPSVLVAPPSKLSLSLFSKRTVGGEGQRKFWYLRVRFVGAHLLLLLFTLLFSFVNRRMIAERYETEREREKVRGGKEGAQHTPTCFANFLHVLREGGGCNTLYFLQLCLLLRRAHRRAGTQHNFTVFTVAAFMMSLPEGKATALTFFKVSTGTVCHPGVDELESGHSMP